MKVTTEVEEVEASKAVTDSQVRTTPGDMFGYPHRTQSCLFARFEFCERYRLDELSQPLAFQGTIWSMSLTSGPLIVVQGSWF